MDDKDFENLKLKLQIIELQSLILQSQYKELSLIIGDELKNRQSSNQSQETPEIQGK